MFLPPKLKRLFALTVARCKCFFVGHEIIWKYTESKKYINTRCCKHCGRPFGMPFQKFPPMPPKSGIENYLIELKERNEKIKKYVELISKNYD